MEEKNIKKIKEKQNLIGPILEIDLNGDDVTIFNLSIQNEELNNVDTTNIDEYLKWKNNILKQNNATIGIGKYAENRPIYKSDLFKNEDENRSFHLGIDVNTNVDEKIFAPLDSTIHSFNNNNKPGDYGPTIILEHNFDGIIFYTLYGHLSEESLIGLYERKEIKKGDLIGYVGNSEVNGGWTPHLHFQLILDMMGKKGDFPGVCKPSEKEKWMKICPDPNLILKIEALK